MVNVRGLVYAVLGLHHPWGINAGFVAGESETSNISIVKIVRIGLGGRRWSSFGER